MTKDSRKDAREDNAQDADPTPAGTSMRHAARPADDNRAARRHHRQSQAAQLGAANVEESPHMDRGDSAEGTGESLGHGRDGRDAAPKPPQRGAVDTQYGTRSVQKTGAPADAGAEASKGGDRPGAAPNPGSSEESSGADRDTMTGSRPGSGT